MVLVQTEVGHHMLAPDVQVSRWEPPAQQFLLVDADLSLHAHQVCLRFVAARVAAVIYEFVAVLVYHDVEHAKIVLGSFAEPLGLQTLASVLELKWLSKSSCVRLDFADAFVVPTAAALFASGRVNGRVDGQLVDVD